MIADKRLKKIGENVVGSTFERNNYKVAWADILGAGVDLDRQDKLFSLSANSEAIVPSNLVITSKKKVDVKPVAGKKATVISANGSGAQNGNFFQRNAAVGIERNWA